MWLSLPMSRNGTDVDPVNNDRKPSKLPQNIYLTGSVSKVWLSIPMSRNRMDTDPVNDDEQLLQLHQDWPNIQIFI